MWGKKLKSHVCTRMYIFCSLEIFFHPVNAGDWDYLVTGGDQFTGVYSSKYYVSLFQLIKVNFYI